VADSTISEQPIAVATIPFVNDIGVTVVIRDAQTLDDVGVSMRRRLSIRTT
jgi:hypothetical protein